MSSYVFQFLCGDGKAGAPFPSQPTQVPAPAQLALAAPLSRPRPSAAPPQRSSRVQLSPRVQERSVSRRRRRSRTPSHRAESRPRATGNVPGPPTIAPGSLAPQEYAKLAHLAVLFTPKAVSATCTSRMVSPTTAVASPNLFLGRILLSRCKTQIGQ